MLHIGDIAIYGLPWAFAGLGLLLALGAWCTFQARRRVWRLPGILMGCLAPLLMAATYTGLPIALTNSTGPFALANYPSWQYFAVLRLGVNAPGDAPPQWFIPSATACTIPGGDIGSQVATPDGGCMNADFASGPKDVREWGAPTDGTHDAGAAINACLSAVMVCFVPQSASGLFVSTAIAIPSGGWLVGSTAGAANIGGSTFTGSSFLNCAGVTSGACVTWGAAQTLASGGVRDLTIMQPTAVTAASGQKGLVFAGGYNVRVENVSVYNFDTCLEFDQGISGQGVNNYAQLCKTHYWVFNTWPEFSQTGGRSGANGSGNYNSAADDVYYTSSLGAGGGGTGPNSIDFVNYKFENDQTSCGFRWGNWTVSPGSEENYNFVNVYKEPMPSGSSLFCSDSTVPKISGLHFTHGYVSQDTGPGTLFGGMNAATEMDSWKISDSEFFVTGGSVAPTGGSPGFNNSVFSGNTFPGLAFTPGGTSRVDTLTLIGNHFVGAVTINQGAHGWQGFSLLGGSVPSQVTDNSDHFNVSMVLPSLGASTGQRTVATLPSCGTSEKGFFFSVIDAASPSYGAAVTGGGAALALVGCNGAQWLVQ